MRQPTPPGESNLLSEEQLSWSPIVANSRMNRERNASGINSYEKEFGFKPEIFLQSKIEAFGNASWLDLCCGHGKAIIQTAEYFFEKGLQDHVRFTGVDLIGDFLFPDPPIKNVVFEAGSIIAMNWHEKYDLITCVHGLHYLGDKLKAIESAANSLRSYGLFIANLDLRNIIVNDNEPGFIKALFKKNGLDYNIKSKLLKKNGHSHVHFDLTYLGADDSTGPNYTGQDAVTSYYSL